MEMAVVMAVRVVQPKISIGVTWVDGKLVMGRWLGTREALTCTRIG